MQYVISTGLNNQPDWLEWATYGCLSEVEVNYHTNVKSLSTDFKYHQSTGIKITFGSKNRKPYDKERLTP